MTRTTIGERLGRVDIDCSRSIWVMAQRVEDLAACAALLDELDAAVKRVDLAFFIRDSPRGAVAARFPDQIEVPRPWPFSPPVWRLMRRLNPRLVLVLGRPHRDDRAILKVVRKRKLPLVLVDPATLDVSDRAVAAGDAGAQPLDPSLLAGVSMAFAGNETMAQGLVAAGLARDRITVPEGKPTPAALATEIVSALRPLLAQDLKLLRGRSRPLRRLFEGGLLAALSRPFWRRVLSYKLQRLDSLEDLRRSLADPQTILCLGNGPSSEDERLLALEHDCLFRVNDSWLGRGFLARPDVVFTASKAALGRLENVIFGFLTVESEGRLSSYWLFRPVFRRLRYLAVERFGLFLTQGAWCEIRPTNGASMLATAVALQPRRLVIAGIDLFQHPAGSYPGDSKTANAYTPGHDAAKELSILLHALDLYRGEIVILSEALAREWDRHRRSPGAGQAATRDAAASGGA